MHKEFNPEKKQREIETLESTTQKRDSLIKRDSATYDLLIKRVAYLKSKYQNYTDYKIYHVLTGSSPIEELSPLFDFPGDDSVGKFIESLEKSSDSKP